MKKILLITSFFIISSTLWSQYGPAVDLFSNQNTINHSTAEDIDNDGDNDIIFITDTAIFIQENLGSGNFDFQKEIIGSGGVFINCSDINGDNLKDIIIGKDTSIFWYENSGSGTFLPPISIISDASLLSFSLIEDVDLDGDLDVFFLSKNGGKLYLTKNTGSGNFSPKELISSIAYQAISLSLADFNGDNQLDILTVGVLGSPSSLKNVWYENLGTSFGTEQVLPWTYTGNSFPSDIDSDGDQDILLITSSADPMTNNGIVSWLENDGLGVFTQPTNTIIVSGTSGTSNHLGLCSDMDQDGDIDLIVNSNLNQLLYIENVGSGNFNSPQIIHEENDGLNSLYTSDIIGNGFQDIVLSNSTGTGMTTSNSAINIGIGIIKNTGLNNFERNNNINYNPTYPVSILALDVEANGKTDLLTSYKNDNPSTRARGIGWYKNKNGYLLEQEILSLTNGSYRTNSSDLNNDGLNDIIIFGDGASTSMNLGNGNFSPWKNIPGGTYYGREAVLNDIDNDGDDDIITTSSLSGKICLYENVGDSFLTEQILIPGAELSITSCWALDYDLDGDKDIFTVSNATSWPNSTTSIDVWPNNNGVFSTSTSFYYSSSSISTNNRPIISGADIDMDGDEDLLLMTSLNGFNLFENISGTFNRIFIGPMPGGDPLFLKARDIDNDNDQDVLFVSDGKLVFYENTGLGTFNSNTLISIGGSDNISATFFDKDNDGDIDIAATMKSQKRIVLFENFHINKRAVSGNLYIDQNQNGQRDSIEVGLNQISVTSSPLPSASYSNSIGDYLIKFNSANNLTYQIYPQGLQYWNITSDSLIYNINVDSSFTSIDSLDFGFYPDSVINNINTEIVGGFPRCNSIINYWLNVTNIGTTIPSGVIHLLLDDSISYINSAITPDSIIGQNIYWHYDSLFYFSDELVKLQVQIPDFSSLGDTLISYLNVSAFDSLSNVTIHNTSDTLSQVSICAYDPNDKIAIPKGIDSLGYINPNTDFIEYTIRFQNTGNDTALTVNILDQLDTNLVWNSLTKLASSDPVQINIDQNGEVNFKFENILLPDSGADFIGSQGFVKYKINLKTGLVPGTNIFNTASIYFDQNPAVVTNTKIHTIYDCNLLPISLLNQTNCYGEQLIAYSSEGNLNNYIWNIDSFYSSTADSLNWLTDTTGAFNLTLTSINQICSKDTTVNFTVLPEIPIINESQTICQDDSLLIYGSYQNLASVYYDSLLAANGCDSIVSTTLFVNPLPSVSLTNFNPDTLCVNATLVTLPNGTPTGGNYSGNGVIGSDFNPSIAGIGTHSIIYTYIDGNTCINSDTTIITIDICTEIDNISTNFGIIIYPNPATGQFTIEKPEHLNKELQLTLLDATSKVIQEKVIPIRQQKVEMDIRNYSKGIYFLQLIVDDEIFVKQILKN